MSVAERALSLGHKVVVSGLVFLSAWGITFIGAASVDIYTRQQERKRINEAKAAAAAASKS